MTPEKAREVLNDVASVRIIEESPLTVDRSVFYIDVPRMEPEQTKQFIADIKMIFGVGRMSQEIA